jgi:hypothetical protein
MDQINTVELFSSVKVFNRLSGVFNESDYTQQTLLRYFVGKYVERNQSKIFIITFVIIPSFNYSMQWTMEKQEKEGFGKKAKKTKGKDKKKNSRSFLLTNIPNSRRKLARVYTP